jgi:predicted dehydrogenase
MEQALAFAPDAVFISSPASEHLANALPFVARNVPLFLEKPLAASADQLGDFAARCERSNGFTMVGYVLRFLPALHAVRKCLKNGTLGVVHTARIEVGQYLPDWRPDSDYRQGVTAQRKLGGGALLELSHEIDYATWLFGWPQTLQCSSARLSALEIDVEDSAHLVLEYANKRVNIQLDLLQRVATMAVQIVGSHATLMVDLLREQVKLIEPMCPHGRLLEHPVLPDSNDIYLRQFDFFLTRAIAGYRPAYSETEGFADWSNVESAGRVLELIDLAKQASATGMRQSVPFAEAMV